VWFSPPLREIGAHELVFADQIIRVGPQREIVIDLKASHRIPGDFAWNNRDDGLLRHGRIDGTGSSSPLLELESVIAGRPRDLFTAL
jgi:hypothetical protein